ncbi:hypothetical protein M9458_046178, partial [Cirrhinus mrigala]
KVHSAAAQLQRQPDSAPVSPPLPSEPPVDCIVEERRVEVYSASLLDHERPKRKWRHGPWCVSDFKTPLTLSPKQQQLLCSLTWRAGFFD